MNCVYCRRETKREKNALVCWKCYYARLPLQTAAYRELWRAKRDGRVGNVLGKLCMDCQAPASVWDHRDYSRPLDVDAVCWSCNNRRGPANWQPAQQEAAA